MCARTLTHTHTQSPWRSGEVPPADERYMLNGSSAPKPEIKLLPPSYQETAGEAAAH